MCPACGSAEMESLLEVPCAPISCGQLFSTRDAAIQAGQCRLEIVLCRQCDHIWNSAHDGTATDIYNDDYYSSFTASSQGRQYQETLARNLDQMVRLARKTVVEIGCGDGFFLQSLHSLGARAIGFEPSSTYGIAKIQTSAEIYQEQFSFESPPEIDSKVDVVVMRHVLEHLTSPRKALECLKSNFSGPMGPRFLFLEVPNVFQLLKEHLYFDFYNDHVHYFSYSSLTRLSNSAGWFPLAPMGGDAEFLRLVCVNPVTGAKLDAGPGESLFPSESEDIASAASRFREDFQQWREGLVKLLSNYRAAGSRMAVWGAGARGVALLSGLGLPGGTYEYIVDSDSNKHGKYLPVIHQHVSPPERIRQDPVDCVLVTSYTYFDEIVAQLDWFRSMGGKVIKVYPTPVVV